jgi:pimeloyl-ACP methyl ester carboxylesterase
MELASLPQPDDSAISHRTLRLHEVSLHVAEAGEGTAGRPPVVLLHGFPEFWFGWRHQLLALAQAGYRVWAPDMRGYNLSDKPKGVAAYGVDRLARDVAELIDATGASQAIVVGHDWGGLVAWELAAAYPERVERLAILNAPHPAHLPAMVRDPEQARRSHYVLLFQLPGFAPWALQRGEFARMRESLRADAALARRPEAFSAADLARYVQAASIPGATTAMVNYYRAMVRQALRAQAIAAVPEFAPWLGRGGRRVPWTPTPIRARTRVIWGALDPFIGRAYATPPARWVPDAEVVWIDDGAHFVQAERPERVNAELLRFFGERLDVPSPPPPALNR